MNIIPLSMYSMNNYSNQNLNNPNFNGSLDKSVYQFVERSKKLELKALQEHANSINVPIRQYKINSIIGTWNKALKILEEKVKRLHEKTIIRVDTNYSYDLGPLCGHYNHKTEILRASNPNHINKQYLSELNQNELYTSEYRPHLNASDFPDDNICEAKRFLRKIKSVKFNKIDINFYKMEKCLLLSSDFTIPESFVDSVVKFGKEIGKKTPKRFFRQVKRHNRRLEQETQTRNNNNQVIQTTISSLN